MSVSSSPPPIITQHDSGAIVLPSSDGLPSASPLGLTSTPVTVTTVDVPADSLASVLLPDAIEMFPDPVPDLLDRDDVSISSSVPSTDSLVDCCLVDDFNLNALHFESVTPHYSDAIELDDDSVSPDNFICHECTLCSTSASI